VPQCPTAGDANGQKGDHATEKLVDIGARAIWPNNTIRNILSPANC